MKIQFYTAILIVGAIGVGSGYVVGIKLGEAKGYEMAYRSGGLNARAPDRLKGLLDIYDSIRLPNSDVASQQIAVVINDEIHEFTERKDQQQGLSKKAVCSMRIKLDSIKNAIVDKTGQSADGAANAFNSQFSSNLDSLRSLCDSQ
jgi:hypothetical protein